MKDDYSLIVKDWLIQDEGRSTAIALAADLGLKDWCLAAGFVRNLVWDKLHGYEEATPLNDIDLIYYDKSYCSEIIDRTIEKKLKEKTDLPWSVKNQARMHMRNDDAPYHSTSDAMSYWVEVETAVGVRLAANGLFELVAPFGIESLFEYTVTINDKRRKYDDFIIRIQSKRWLQHWPMLKIIR